MKQPTLSNAGADTNISRGLEPKGSGMVTLHQLEQNPVAWMDKEDCGDMRFTSVAPTYENDLIPLYTAPPRKPWVGLTDDDIELIFFISGSTPENFARDIEAILKEKNDVI
jgi:hypothetical protein